MVKIELEFECTALDGVCSYSLGPNICLDNIGETNLWVCPWLKATRKAKTK